MENHICAVVDKHVAMNNKLIFNIYYIYSHYSVVELVVPNRARSPQRKASRIWHGILAIRAFSRDANLTEVTLVAACCSTRQVVYHSDTCQRGLF